VSPVKYKVWFYIPKYDILPQAIAFLTAVLERLCILCSVGSLLLNIVHMNF
jgi:hypothetical protein